MDVEADVNQLKGAYEHLATKEDLVRLEGKIDANLARLEGNVDSNIVRLEGKIDSAIANVEKRLTRWIAGGIGVVVIGIVANIFVQLIAN